MANLDNKPDTPFKGGDPVSASKLEAMRQAIKRQFVGAGTTNIEQLGDRLLIKSTDPGARNNDVSGYIAPFVVVEEFDDYLKCASYQHPNDGTFFTGPEYDPTFGSTATFFTYVAKPLMLQRRYWDGKTINDVLYTWTAIGERTADSTPQEAKYAPGEIIQAKIGITGLVGPDDVPIGWIDLNNSGLSYASPDSVSDTSRLDVFQTSHGFIVGDAVYFNGSNWSKADASNGEKLSIGIICYLNGDDAFTVQFSGYITGLSGFTPGQYYFVSATTPGALQLTEPAPANWSNPILFVLTSTTGVVLPWRPSRMNTTLMDAGTITGDTIFEGDVTHEGDVNYEGGDINVNANVNLNLATGVTYRVTGSGFFIFESPAKFKGLVFTDYANTTLNATNFGIALPDKTEHRLSPTGTNSVLAGVIPKPNSGTGWRYRLWNVKASSLIIIVHESAGATAAEYRFVTPKGKDINLRHGDGVEIWYDPIHERHRVMGVYLTSPLTTKGDIYVRDSTEDTRLPVGFDDYFLNAKSSEATGLKWVESPDTSRLGVAQEAHGFSVGQAVYYDGLLWALADSSDGEKLGLGIVCAVTNADAFVVQFSGKIYGMPGSLTAGTRYYVSETTPGALVDTEPAAPAWSNPLYFALGATNGVVLPWRPRIGRGAYNQILGMNADGTALEWKTIMDGYGISITHDEGTVTINNECCNDPPLDQNWIVDCVDDEPNQKFNGMCLHWANTVGDEYRWSWVMTDGGGYYDVASPSPPDGYTIVVNYMLGTAIFVDGIESNSVLYEGTFPPGTSPSSVTLSFTAGGGSISTVTINRSLC